MDGACVKVTFSGFVDNDYGEKTDSPLYEADSQIDIDVPLNGGIDDDRGQVQEMPVYRCDVFLDAHRSIFPRISNCLRAW